MRSTELVILLILLIPYSLSVSPFTDFQEFFQAEGGVHEFIIISNDVHQRNQLFEKEVAIQSQSIQNLSVIHLADHKYDIFCTTRALTILIQPQDISSFFESMSQISSASKCDWNKTGRQIHELWKPCIFLFWPSKDSTLSRVEFENRIISFYTICCLERKTPFSMDSQFYIVVANIENTNVFELYSIQSKIVLREILMQNPTNLFEIIQSSLSRRQNFMGARLRAIGQADTEYYITVNFKDDHGRFMNGGYDSDYFDLMTTSLNISPIAIKGDGRIIKYANGSMNGFGKQLLNDESDISITHSEYLDYRFKKLSFLHPHYVSRLAVFFQQPTATTTRDIYLQSIPNDLLIVILGTSFVTLACLVIISVIHKIYSENKDLPEHNIGNVVVWVVAANCQQGSHNQPSKIPMKIGLLVCYFFGVMVYIAFSTSVVSQLSIPFVPIKTFDDIIKSDMTLSPDLLTQSAHEYLEHAKGEKRLNSGRVENPPVDPSLVFNKIINDRLAYLSVGDEFYMTQRMFNYTDEKLCKSVSNIKVDPIGMPVVAGMILPKSSPYTRFFKYKQTQMREVGLHDRLFDAYMSRSTPACQYIQSKKDIIHLGLNDTITAFIFLIISFLISFIILCIERTMRKTRNRYFDEKIDSSLGRKTVEKRRLSF